MVEKEEFSDLMLEKDSENKVSKFKKFILLAGVFLLIFLLILIVMKAINKPDKANDAFTTSNPNQAINIDKPKDDPLFKQVPIIQEENKKESFEEMVKKLKEKESKRAQEQKQAIQEPKTINEPKTTQAPQEVTVPIVPEVKPEPVKQPAKPQPVAKPAKPKPTPKPVAKPKPKVAKKPSIPKIKVPKAKNLTPEAGKTYIQVLATSKYNSDKAFLNKIKAKNYPYRLYKTNVNGVKFIKVLVGPYDTSKQARSALPKVKQDLNPKAFIFKVK